MIGGPLFLLGDARALPLASGAAALIVTSPPYWNARAYSAWPTYAAYLADMRAAWAECWRVLCPGGRIAVNVPLGYGRPSTGGYLPIGDDTGRALQAAGLTLRGHIVWDKSPSGLGTAWGSWQSASNPSLRDCHEVIILAHKGQPWRPRGADTIDRATFLSATASVWRIRPAAKSWHPAPYPAELARRLIELYSYAGDLVLDPFAGSFTTVTEAARAGRRAVGVEACAAYVAQARAAWAATQIAASGAPGPGGGPVRLLIGDDLPGLGAILQRLLQVGSCRRPTIFATRRGWAVAELDGAEASGLDPEQRSKVKW